jgi:ferrous iron transport protein B
MNYPRLPAQSLAGLTFDQARQSQLANSVIGRLGHAIEPAIRPLGFDWKIGTALIGATPAKELFVSQLGIIYAVSSHDDAATIPTLRQHLRADYSPLVGFCVMLFCLITFPCISTLAVTRSETGAWRWVALQVFYLTALAYLVTFVVYQIGTMLL